MVVAGSNCIRTAVESRLNQSRIVVVTSSWERGARTASGCCYSTAAQVAYLRSVGVRLGGKRSSKNHTPVAPAHLSVSHSDGGAAPWTSNSLELVARTANLEKYWPINRLGRCANSCDGGHHCGLTRTTYSGTSRTSALLVLCRGHRWSRLPPTQVDAEKHRWNKVETVSVGVGYILYRSIGKWRVIIVREAWSRSTRHWLRSSWEVCLTTQLTTACDNTSNSSAASTRQSSSQIVKQTRAAATDSYASAFFSHFSVYMCVCV